MFKKRYSDKDVQALVLKLKKEYDAVVRRQREVCEDIKSENRTLRARLSVLESQREEVSNALIHALEEGERIKEAGTLQVNEEQKELLLLAEKCRLLSDKLSKKYPDEEDCSDFKAFTDALRKHLGIQTEEEEEEETGFDLDEVLNPSKPLDLGQLCRDLGLMEEDE